LCLLVQCTTSRAQRRKIRFRPFLFLETLAFCLSSLACWLLTWLRLFFRTRSFFSARARALYPLSATRMGWLSWERFGCNIDCDRYPDSCISERLYLQQAKALVRDGYLDAGYSYVNVDDCWSEVNRDGDGNLVEDRKRFPSGMRNLSRTLHEMGLKFGLYGDIGSATCAGYPGFADHFEQDARKLALEYEVDSIKVDGCHSDSSIYNITYPTFGTALNKTGRPILYNCQWPLYLPQSQRHGESPDILTTQIRSTCNQWRNYHDVADSWGSVRSVIDYWSRNSSEDVLVRAAGPGGFNDPDMLVVGNPGLSLSEQKAQFALYAVFASPLMISADLLRMPKESKRILLNREVVSVNQDRLGRQGWCVEGCSSSNRVYVRELTPSRLHRRSQKDGRNSTVYDVSVPPKGTSDTWAVVLANFKSMFGPKQMLFDPVRHLPRGDSWTTTYSVRDLFDHESSESVVGSFAVDVDESSVRMFKVQRLDIIPPAGSMGGATDERK